MKKLFNTLIILLLVFVLTGCTLASEDEYYVMVDGNEDANNYVPIEINFRLIKDNDYENPIDLNDYINISWFCENEINSNCTSFQYGSTMEPIIQKVHSEHNTIDDIVQPKVITMTIEANIYFNQIAATNTLYSDLILINDQDETKTQHLMGVVIGGGLSTTNTVRGKYEDESTIVIEYTLHYIEVDDLQLVTIRQYDEDDQFLEETVVSKYNLLDELVLNDNTDYYFIIESYLDADNNVYTERSFYTSDETTYFLYKYLNIDGFLNGDRLIIEKLEQ